MVRTVLSLPGFRFNPSSGDLRSCKLHSVAKKLKIKKSNNEPLNLNPRAEGVAELRG